MSDLNFNNTREDKKIVFNNTREDTAKKKSSTSTGTTSKQATKSGSRTYSKTRRSNTTSKKSTSTSFETEVSSWKKIVIFFVFVIVFIILLSAIIAANKPNRKITHYLSNGNYTKAVTLYNEKIYGHSKKENIVDPIIASYMEELADSYYTGTLKYENVQKAFNEFEKLSKYDLSQYASAKLEDFLKNEVYKKIFADAEEKFQNKDYLAAMVSYKSIPDSFHEHSICEEHYNLCRDTLLENLPIPEKEADYINCISILDGYIDIIADSGFVEKRKDLQSQYDTLVTDTKRKEILDDAKSAFEEKQYTKAFKILEDGISNLSNDTVLTKQLNTYHEFYVSEIKETVNTLLTEEKFDDTLNIIAKALEIYDCDIFRELQETVYIAKEESFGTYNAPDITFINKTGSISSNEDIDTYSFDAEIEGDYCLTFSEMEYDFNIRVRVINYLHEEVKNYIISNNESLCTGSIPSGKYTVEVSYRRGTGSYQFAIGQPKPITNINSYAVINDSIEYDDQSNKYSFTPECSGTYRFDFSEMLYDTSIDFGIYDHLNTPVKEARVSGSEGITVEKLNANEKYSIRITQHSGLTKYTISIGRQKPTKVIDAGKKVAGNIKFVGQRDLYVFKPTVTREFTITGNESDWPNWYIEMFDSNNVPLDFNYDGDYCLKVSLQADTEYLISCYYKDSFTTYSFTIN